MTWEILNIVKLQKQVTKKYVCEDLIFFKRKLCVGIFTCMHTILTEGYIPKVNGKNFQIME